MVSNLCKNATLAQILHKPHYLKVLSRSSNSSKPQEAVFIEKLLEDPVVVVNEEDYVDLIGPPNAVSNLRPIIRKKLLNETSLQRKLREFQDATQDWNQSFWAKHNTNFINKRKEFIENHPITKIENRQLTADEMSVFYKQFLDENWKLHVEYNFDWYRRNFAILFLSLRVQCEKYLRL